MKKSEALRILGLADGASDEDVKKAHRKLVIEHHPDKFPLNSTERADAEELTKQINEARDVLLNRSWTPEFDPRRDPRPYAYNPYAHPSSTAAGASGNASGSAGAGGAWGTGSAGDPFAGWPFGQGQTTYVWTSWDGVRGSWTEDARPASGAGARSTGGSGAGADPFAGFTSWPFDFTVAYDDADPFAPFREAARPSAREAYADAKAHLVREGVCIAAKLAVLAVLAAVGSAPAGLFAYVIVSVLYGLYKRLGSCLVGLAIPLAVVCSPLLFLIAPRNGTATLGLALASIIAFAFDIRRMRDLLRAWRVARDRVRREG